MKWFHIYIGKHDYRRIKVEQISIMIDKYRRNYNSFTETKHAIFQHNPFDLQCVYTTVQIFEDAIQINVFC